ETGRAQKLAQTFKAPEGAHKLASVSLPLSGAAKAVVKVYEVGERPPFGTLLKEMVVTVGDASGEPASGWVRLPVRPAVAMKAGHRYSLVLKTDRKRDQLWTSHANDRYRGGQSWCFCPVWKNQEIDFDTLRWQSAEDLDRPTDDLAFELRFWRKG
ncbi:MAG TPA: hypothetical protein VEV43_04050, partial [Actinomycetota bacterium]|nr:hypothetical protein [Actinomycetota bacterium]